jgi:hypothetical protein
VVVVLVVALVADITHIGFINEFEGSACWNRLCRTDLALR